MRAIEFEGIGIRVEIYVRDKKEDVEAMKEAVKTIQREVVRRESHISGRPNS